MATHAVGCLHVLGVNLPARHWLPLAAELATAEQQSAAQRTAALVALSALLYGAGRAGAEADAASVQLAAATLGSPGLSDEAAAPDGGLLRQQLLAATSNLVQWAGPGCAAVAPQLFQLLLRLWAVEAATQLDAAAEKAADAGSGADSLTSAAVLEQLAAACGIGSAAGLCERYGPALLSQCMQASRGGRQAWEGMRAVRSSSRRSSSTLPLGQPTDMQDCTPLPHAAEPRALDARAPRLAFTRCVAAPVQRRRAGAAVAGRAAGAAGRGG